jgi:hypothetical protein
MIYEVPIVQTPFISLRWDDKTARHYIDLFEDNHRGIPTATKYKWLTAHESDELHPWTTILEDKDSDSIIDISVSEILEHQDNGDICLDEDSSLLQLLREAK